MGGIIKFLLISFLILYILSKVWKYIFRGLLWLLGDQVRKQYYERMNEQMNPHSQRTYKTKKEGEVEVQFNPDKQSKKSKKDFRGGDYVDYEEVKD